MRKDLLLFLSVCLMVAGTSADGTPLPRPVRLGIAGLTHDHVHGILGRVRKGDVEIVGICDPDTALASRYARRYALPLELFYADLQKMLEAVKPEAVAAFGSIADHRRVVEACAPCGIHVMVEKPLAFKADDAVRMEELARRHRIHLLTNYETTWYPSVHAAYRIIHADSAIGDLRKIVVHDGHRGPREIGCSAEFLAWLTDPVQNGGGALIDFGCYGANLITWMMKGLAPLTVTAVTQQIKPDIYPKVDDEAAIVLTYPHAQGIIQASWNWPVGRKDMEIYGQRGVILAPDRSTLRVRRSEAESERTETLNPLAAPLDDPFSYLAAVIRGVITVTDEDLSSLPNNVTVVRILDAARRSAATGRTINPAP